VLALERHQRAYLQLIICNAGPIPQPNSDYIPMQQMMMMMMP
jgi:hypothetical protein